MESKIILIINKITTLNYNKIGLEWTKNGTFFITLLFPHGIEVHLEVYFNKIEEDTFFFLYQGDDCIITGADSFEASVRTITDFITESKS